ncbi:GSCFA domain-containing protein [Hymenobacter negativus]|uniref:GSCFA domain-containing protein n=1 Tax=Hymenobacter negativus TaxID=2795026 RepID=A0ABS3QQ12_9BACT|nr:GSCFA domain-containing protein [Hymenobacter negativus]MBO2012775.1 GSCFA domain-containing protein [Hymenobacter negativus]
MFRTELTIAPAAGQLARTAQVLTMGSCFADSIGARLVANKVETRVNPFGTVFQPLALARLLRSAAGEDVDWQRHLVQARGRWQSYDLHGSVGAESPVELLQYIQEVVRQTGDFLRTADVVMLTLGTAWAYRLRETGELVSNCHKQPADLFVRELLTPDEIINALAETHAYLRRINPSLRFVLTVSPVRHLKETLQLNAVSKSVLRLATHIVSDLLPGVAYFPAYELLVDDLRDYRFYASDMLHPSEVAEDYIWEKFARAYFDADFGRFRKEWAAVRQSLSHRPLHDGAPEHRQFLESTREKLEQLSLRKVNVADELRTVRARLASLPVPREPEPVVELEDDEERIDIGEGSEVSVIVRVNPQDSKVADAAEETLSAELGQFGDAARAPRLSPEEFRAQRAARSGRPERGRRDGRNKGQLATPNENEQFQATTPVDESPTPTLAPTAAEVNLIEQIEVGGVLATDATAAQEPVKRKKRRSRGGAKRTARKHALRLAAEMDSSEEQQAVSGEGLAAPAGLEAEAPVLRPEGQKSSVIVKSQPVKRGGRRNEAGRMPRVALFAASLAEEPMEAQPVDAEMPTPVVATLEATLTKTRSTAADEPAVSPSRNSRNRKKKKAARALEAGVTNETVPPILLVAEVASDLPIASAEQLSGTDANGPATTIETQADDTRRASLPVAALPVSGQASAATTVGEAVVGQSVSSGGKSSRRAKSRTVSGARTEKPAVDTPIIPVSDSPAVRTQVAGGRLTGSSATLVEPSAPAPEAAPKVVTAKAVPSKAKVKAKSDVAIEPVVATAPDAAAVTAATKGPPKAQPKATKPKAGPNKPTVPEVTDTSAAIPDSDKPVVAKKAANRSAKTPAKEATVTPVPAEKPKPAAKTPAKKTVAKPDAEPEEKKALSKAKAPKAAAAEPTTAKPKTPKKSAS